MNKENNKSAAGLRRSAIAERIRLREEWSALKGTESQGNDKQKKVLTKKQTNVKVPNAAKNGTDLYNKWRKPSSRSAPQTDNTLCGVVALVDVGSEARALPLRAALSALGATVLPAWSPLVTHLVWSQGGSRATRAKARALACRLVSPLWVEACAAASRRLPEQAFPSAARESDLPSPRSLRRMLKKAEMENIPLNFLSESAENKHDISIETEKDTDTSRDTTNDTSIDTTNDTSRDTTNDTSKDTTNDTSRDISKDTTNETTKENSVGETRVNTAPRRALPMSTSPAPVTKSRRKLFTQKEADGSKESGDDEETLKPKPRKPSFKPSIRSKKPESTRSKKPESTRSKKPEGPIQRPHIDRKELARAERLARKLVTGCTQTTHNHTKDRFRIALTGMCRTERKTVTEAIKSLNGMVQASVDRRTTHVLVGSFLPDLDYTRTVISGISPLSPVAPTIHPKPRTISALEGAARGCRVLSAGWALASKQGGRWLHHASYELPHLRKVSQIARVERSALGKQTSEYAYDVFCGMRVRVSRDAHNARGAVRLLTLCGAIVRDLSVNEGLTNPPPKIHDGPSQYYVTQHPDVDFDVSVGSDVGDIDSRWVFDSVASGRMRTTRRYVIRRSSQVDSIGMPVDELFTQLQNLGC